MNIIKKNLTLSTEKDKTTYLNITKDIQNIVRFHNIETGICFVVSPHTTCSVFYEEFVHDINEEGDEFLQVDLNNVLNKIIPPHDTKESYCYPGEKHYEEVLKWEDADKYLPNGDKKALWNGDAHIKSTLIGTSQVFTIEDSQLEVGSTGSIYFADFDTTRERTRTCRVIIIGD